MGSDKSCWQKLTCCLTTISVLAIAGTIAWYVMLFTKDVESPVGDCGGCHCIPDETTAFECPSNNNVPPSSYPEQPHRNSWNSQTILNPYVLNCNPFEDGVFCDTEPPLDPDFEWVKLGETAVCAIHYEAEEPQRRQRGLMFQDQRRQEEEQSEIINTDPEFETGQSEIEIEIDNDNNNNNDNNTEDEDENEPIIIAVDNESDTCDNVYYRIKTYPSREDAELAGGFVTHVGSCGVCSTLQDLAVYANFDEIGATSPGNFCKRQAATSFENGLSCYRGLGMTQDCAKMWADTSWNTAKNCFGTCVFRSTLPQFGGGSDAKTDTNNNSTEAPKPWYDITATLRSKFVGMSVNETEAEMEKEIEIEKEMEVEDEVAPAIPSNGPAPECALNDCITCNNEFSAPTFEKFAGRSRRRSGLLSTAARLCGSIPNIVHDPCPSTLPLPLPLPE